MTMTTSFPIDARVILQDLMKAPDLNGKKGIIKSELSNGRQHVYVTHLNKSVALKISNLRYEGRTMDSLSVKELKSVLKANDVSELDLSGSDKPDLQSKVSNLKLNDEKLAEILALENAPKPAAASSSVNPTQAANALANMSPDQLRQQARAMRSMPPDQLRRMNPQFANMTNDQILMAANQMEMMANNPHMMRAAADQVKNMQPGDIERMQREMQNGNIDLNAASTPTPAESQYEQASNIMANMTPEQMNQQAQMMKSMDPATLRRMNPQFASMSDEQLKTAASQFEMMSNNPSMMKMAMDQMKHMTPEQINAMQNGTPPNMDSMGDMLENMDTKQFKQMLSQVKTNPDMMKQFSAMSGLSEQQMSQGIDQFANMDEKHLDKAVNVMKKAQKAKNLWGSLNAKTGGHLIKIIGGVCVLIVLLFVNFWFSSRDADVPVTELIKEDVIPNVESVDEFGEF